MKLFLVHFYSSLNYLSFKFKAKQNCILFQYNRLKIKVFYENVKKVTHLNVVTHKLMNNSTLNIDYLVKILNKKTCCLVCLFVCQSVNTFGKHELKATRHTKLLLLLLAQVDFAFWTRQLHLVHYFVVVATDLFGCFKSSLYFHSFVSNGQTDGWTDKQKSIGEEVNKPKFVSQK